MGNGADEVVDFFFDAVVVFGFGAGVVFFVVFVAGEGDISEVVDRLNLGLLVDVAYEGGET